MYVHTVITTRVCVLYCIFGYFSKYKVYEPLYYPKITFKSLLHFHLTHSHWVIENWTTQKRVVLIFMEQDIAIFACFHSKLGKLGKNGLILLHKNWNYLGLGLTIFIYSRAAVQAGVSAYLKCNINLLASGKPSLWVKISQNTV